MSILDIKNLVTEFGPKGNALRAVDHVSFSVSKGETLGIVGESGCGKSVTAQSIMRLIPDPPGRIAHGSIHYQGEDLVTLSEASMRHIRGNQISMIFQEPMTSLNPVITAGEQIAEVIRLHQKLPRNKAKQIAIEMLHLVGIPEPQLHVQSYPHELSGGMRQRVMIAIALACKPELLIADEPTTALDVTIQAQILALLKQLQQELHMSIMLITHDLGVVAETCDDVIVMYAGRIVERAKTQTIFSTPRHPYTMGLLNSIPKGPNYKNQKAKRRLQEIPGIVPPLYALPSGCKFSDRCDAVQEKCRTEEPELVQLGEQWVRCHFPVPESQITN